MGEPKMVRSVTIDKELVKFRFLGDWEMCGLQLLLVLGYAYGVDNSHDNIGDFVCPIMNNAFNLYFHTPLFNGFMLYAVASALSFSYSFASRRVSARGTRCSCCTHHGFAPLSSFPMIPRWSRCALRPLWQRR